MSPRTPKGKRGELPKPVIRTGTVGVLPVRPLSIAYLHAGHGDLLIGHRDKPETVFCKESSAIQIREGKKREAFSMDGRIFNSYADALYRGKLPEVILAFLCFEELDTFLNDFVDYVEKLLSLGFFLPKKEIIRRDPVEQLIPAIVLCGSGLLFSQFITALMRNLQGFEKPYPIMDEALRTRILGRFVRGQVSAEMQPWSGNDVILPPIDTLVRIAGGHRHTQELVQTVLSTHGLVASRENRTRNAVERLELESALWRLSDVILPALVKRKLLSKSQIAQIAPKLQAGILAIGKRRHAFDETDSIKSMSGMDVSFRGKARKPALSPQQDATILTGLGQFAEILDLTEEQQLFEQLARQLTNA